MDEEDLERMLTGADGIPALDAAREIRAIRAERDEARGAMLKYQDTAEMLIHEKATACERFEHLLEVLANLLASARG